MKKALSAFLVVLAMTLVSIILADSISTHTGAHIGESVLIANLISIALAVVLYAKFFEDQITIRPSYLEEAIQEMERKSPPTDAQSNDTSPSPNRANQIARKGMTKKGDKLSPEHRAKISASLKKRSQERKAQDARIAKTQKTKLSRKKSGK